MCDTESSTATERSRSSAAYNFFAGGHVRGWAIRFLGIDCPFGETDSGGSNGGCAVNAWCRSRASAPPGWRRSSPPARRGRRRYHQQRIVGRMARRLSFAFALGTQHGSGSNVPRRYRNYTIHGRRSHEDPLVCTAREGAVAIFGVAFSSDTSLDSKYNNASW